jgi:hypothetical protein
MLDLSEARAIQISPLFHPAYEDVIRHLCDDAPIREVSNHSEIDNALMVRIPGERFCGLSPLAFYTIWAGCILSLAFVSCAPGLNLWN